MAAGLSTRLNLSEKGLDATDALGKLYAPQTQEDVNLFSFASRLESFISSATSLEEPNQIFGLINNNIFLLYEDYYVDSGSGYSDVELLLTEDEAEYLATEDDRPLNYDPFKFILDYRTKFVTNYATFSNENKVWFSRVSGYTLDQRAESETLGAPIKVSDSGQLVSVSVQGVGSGYTVEDENGTEVGSYPANVTVNVRGLESGSVNGKVTLTVSSGGEISRQAIIVDPGSNYRPSEYLEIIPTCQENDEPVEDKCIRYTGNTLHLGDYAAILRNERYLYTVKSSDQSGFYLYDEIAQDWVYLGEVYNSLQAIPFSETPSVVLRRSDAITSDNLSRLYGLNGRSFFFTYNEAYEPSSSLSNSIRNASESVERIKSDLPLFAQNLRLQGTESGLRFSVNSFEGKNLQTDYRMVFRDPDGILDSSSLSFYELRDSTTQENDVSLSGVAIPGIWLFTGEKYQRIFSSDDRPFISVESKDYLSPVLSAEASNRYSIGTGYKKPGSSLVKGFDTVLGTLIQNLSTDAENGGFVFHRQLVVEDVRSIVKSWPMFSYIEDGQIKDARILAIS